MIAVLALLLSIAHPGVVTKAEFDQAEVGMTKHHVHVLWGASGEFAVTYYDETGDEHRVRRYYRPSGQTFLVDYQRKYAHKRFRFDHTTDDPYNGRTS